MRRALATLFLASLLSPTVFSESPKPPDSEESRAIRELEERVTAIKTEVYRSKARAHELEEAVLRGKIVGSKALISFDNRAEGLFTFESAEFYLDGEMIFKKAAGDSKGKPVERLNVFDGDLPAGEHRLEARIFYRGSDKSIYAAFPYFKDHKFEVQSVERFPVEYGKTTQMKLVALDKGHTTGEISERLFVEVSKVRDWGAEPAQ